jgi:hypothetical protein
MAIPEAYCALRELEGIGREAGLRLLAACGDLEGSACWRR